MVHAEARELMAVYDGLALPLRDRIDRHVRTCPECAALLALYRQMDADLAGLADPRPMRGGPAMRRASLAGSAARAGRRVAALDRARGAVALVAPMFALVLLTTSLLFALQSMPRRGLGIGATPSLTPTPTPSLRPVTPRSSAALPVETAALTSAPAAASEGRRGSPTALATLLPLATGTTGGPGAPRNPTP